MKLSEIGLIFLAIVAVAGLFTVITGRQEVPGNETGFSEENNPMTSIERDFAAICIGPGLRDVPSASSDTIVRSMDLVDTISIHQANLYITRSLRRHGFDHVVTYLVPDKGLSFICLTPDGDPVRFELNDTIR
jgi:hypothetical protein